MHEIIVGNIGCVHCSDDADAAKNAYLYYVDTSNANVGRAAGESVIWLIDGEIAQEYFGARDED